MAKFPYPPGPKGLPLAGSLLAFYRDTTGFLLKVAQDYGDIAHFKLGSQDIFLLNHPDYIKDVLVTHQRNFVKGRSIQRAKRLLGEGLLTSEGEFHLRQRRLAQPAFHRQRIAAYATVMTDYARRMMESWQDGATLEISEAMMQLLMAVIAKTLFDAELESDTEKIGEALTELMKLFPVLTLPFAERLEKFPLPIIRRFHHARARLDAIIYRIINERRANNIDRGDLLSMLLLARDENGDGSAMTEAQARDEALTFFLAGHETTAIALAWTWYLLSEHPEAEARLYAELKAVLAGRTPAVEDLAQLQYTKMVFAEAMRLHPPVGRIGRRVLNDYKIGAYVIPADSIIFMSPYVMHHDARLFPAPFVFNPERWTPEALMTRPKFSYFPFGGGIRQCIGEPLAWMAGVLLIATIAQRWQMRLVPGHPIAIQPLMTLRPKYGLRMRLKGR